MALECYLPFLADAQGIGRPDVGLHCFEWAMFRAWVEWMNEEKGYAPKTVAPRIAVVSPFLRWCADEDVSLAALYDGARTVSPPKTSRTLMTSPGDRARRSPRESIATS